jgi:hypothetical protein
VQPISGISQLLGAAVLAEVRPTDRVLDLGTGSGVNAALGRPAPRLMPHPPPGRSMINTHPADAIRPIDHGVLATTRRRHAPTSP